MKQFLKNYFLIIFIYAFHGFVLYPFLHEGSHAVVALIFGAEIGSFVLWPFAYVDVNAFSITPISFFFIAFAGMTVPFFISFLRSKKSLISMAFSVSAKFTAVMAFSISLYSVLANTIFLSYNFPTFDEDIAILIKLFPEYSIISIVLLVILFVLSIGFFIKDIVIFFRLERKYLTEPDAKLLNTFIV